MDEKIEVLRNIIERCSRIVGFTGAGISTESGIADFRSKGGIWDRFQPVYFQEFLSDPDKRRLYWERKIEMWPQIRDARPNAGHLFFKRLYDRGKLTGLITQNIDGLHEKSGIPPEKIVNVHGSGAKTRCLSCDTLYESQEIFETIDLEDSGPPLCGKCGGLLKPDTISFGQNLKPEALEKADELSSVCDAMLCFGSTLIVYPAAGYPEKAKSRGAYLAIVTKSETPLDSLADVVINESIGTVVSGMVF